MAMWRSFSDPYVILNGAKHSEGTNFTNVKLASKKILHSISFRAA
jgi:hypothetical protein